MMDDDEIDEDDDYEDSIKLEEEEAHEYRMQQ